jgi:coenzyme F420-0:L-glutamate ligase/coenzyme F420-1:gamma-L-glutamate ligase
MTDLRLRAIPDLAEVRPGDDLGRMLAPRVPAGEGVLVVAQKIVSKAEGRIVRLSQVRPSREAQELAQKTQKDPRLAEVILGETVRIVRAVPGVLICETQHGLICANAGVDQSNAPGDDAVLLLPEDPDASAERIRRALGVGRAVIVSDTFGRPWREGLVDARGGGGDPDAKGCRYAGGLDRRRARRGERQAEGSSPRPGPRSFPLAVR